MPSIRHVSQTRHFYPRSPCGERQGSTARARKEPLFLSTLSLRRATESQPPCARPTTDFYPRSPCGERRSSDKWQFMRYIFLSTLSLRRATRQGQTGFRRLSPFLSTLSLRRATTASAFLIGSRSHFYPRSPCGERPLEVPARAFLISHFYPRSPCGERHFISVHIVFLSTISIHALLAESDVRPTGRPA